MYFLIVNRKNPQDIKKGINKYLEGLINEVSNLNINERKKSNDYSISLFSDSNLF